MTALTERTPYRILVTGSRHCTDDQAVMASAHIQNVLYREAWQSLRRPVVLVHGQCPSGGVDWVAHQFAQRDGFRDWVSAEAHPADWTIGKAAGPRRNATMVSLGADICLAFPAPDSRGTWDCVRKAAAAGIPVQIWPLVPAPSAPRSGEFPAPAGIGAT